MNESHNTFYITTPIYYVTARPHLGSLYSTLLADVYARWHRLMGQNVFFMTGTDEHGQKIALAAQQAGKQPKEFVDSFIPAYMDAWKAYGIHYNHFMRTTDDFHKKGAQHLVSYLMDKGDIYKAKYEGWYCTPCETFLTEKDLEGHTQNVPACPTCGRATSYISEETYFFKLSAYQEKLLTFYKKNPGFICPKERANEVISFVESGLKDLSISRTTVSWGVPFPNDPEHVLYVWIEALSNYITGIGYGDPAKQEIFKKWWPADVQVLGKDIIRFHAVFWPALLMAADLQLPKRLLVHGWIKVDKQKMSKSLGNVVDPMDLAKEYGVDAVRYYLCRQMSTAQDGDFSIADLEQRLSSDLANDLGNLLQRMTALVGKYGLITIAPSAIWSGPVLDLQSEALSTLQDFEMYMADLQLHLAIARLWKFINATNAFFHAQEPWKQAKNNMAAFNETISATCHALRLIGVLLLPVMPEKMQKLLASIGMLEQVTDKVLHELELGMWKHTFVITKGDTLFIKPEPKETIIEVQQEQSDNAITIDDVVKVQLVVGTIEICEAVPKSDKLLKLQVNFGDKGMRQILSGIAKIYTPQELISKQAVFVFNLKPRQMMGLESHGMLLITKYDNERSRIVSPEVPVSNGAELN